MAWQSEPLTHYQVSLPHWVAQMSAQQIVFLCRWIKDSLWYIHIELPLCNMHPLDFRSSFTRSSVHVVPLSLLIPYQNILVPASDLAQRSPRWPSSVSCPKQSRASGFFLCGPIAHFHTSIIFVALNSIFKLVIFWYNVTSVRGKIVSCSSSTHILKTCLLN